MKKVTGITAFLFFAWITGMAQVADTSGSMFRSDPTLGKYAKTSEKSIRLVFYNLENLFDTINDPVTNDEEFTPTGTKGWNITRYYDKLDKTYQVLTALGGWEMPAIVGVCELENRGALADLIQKTPLRDYDYQIVHEESPDRRGVDVGLIYRPDLFTVISHEAINVTFPFDTATRTRDILYVKGIVFNTDTIHVFINHWPSRWGGSEASAPRRMYVADLIRARVDSLYATEGDPNILITGDFNDEPGDVSILNNLNAKPTIAEVGKTDLYNCMYPYFEKGIGTEKYQEHWGLLDQYIVSEPLLNRANGLLIDGQKAYIFDAPFLKENDEKFLGEKPFRTYSGPKYLGGFSDHFPVYIDLIHKEPESTE